MALGLRRLPWLGSSSEDKELMALEEMAWALAWKPRMHRESPTSHVVPNIARTCVAMCGASPRAATRPRCPRSSVTPRKTRPHQRNPLERKGRGQVRVRTMPHKETP